MTVRFHLPTSFGPRPIPTKKIIRCPYECGGHIDPEIHGEIVDVWQGHGPKVGGQKRA